MKIKKGFTLVELMATIVVLAIIIAIAIPIYNKVSINIKEKNYRNKVKLIETAAAKYSEDTNYETMYVDDLIKDGYLDADDEDGNIYNDLTNERINCYVVKSKEEAGMYYAELLDESYQLEDNTCIANMPNTMNDKLRIIMRLEDGTLFKYDPISKWWTNRDMLLEAKLVLEKEEEVQTVEWYRGYQKIENEKELQIKVSTTSVLQQNYTVKIILTNGKVLNSTVRVYIDKVNPNFYNNDNIDNTNWATKREYSIKAYDNESGLYGYALLNTNESCPIKRKEYQKGKKTTFKENGKHKVCIMDNVGNITNKEITIEKVDSASLACAFSASGTLGNNVNGKQWYKSNVKLTLNSTKEIGPSGISLNISTSSKPVYGEEFSKDLTQISTNVDKNSNGQVYYGYIKNQANTTNSCSYTAYVEKSIEEPKIKNVDTTSYNTLRIDNEFIKPTSDFAKKYCILEMDNILSSVDADKKGTCTYENINGPKTVEVKSCVESKAGNKACSELNTLKIPGLTNIGPPNNVVYAIVHDIYYANPAIYKDCKNAGYASYCRVFTLEDYNYNKNSTVTVVEYCPNPDRTGACLYDTQSSGCSVESFLRISKSNPVNALSPLDKPDLLPEWQTKYKRQDKDNSPLWSKNIDGTYHSNISCKNDDGTADGRYINVQPYQFCDAGCGNGHIKNFENSCNMANAHIYYNQWFYSMGNSFKYNYCIYSSRDDARYYQDEIGNIHDWYVSVDNRIPF